MKYCPLWSKTLVFHTERSKHKQTIVYKYNMQSIQYIKYYLLYFANLLCIHSDTWAPAGFFPGVGSEEV